MKYLDPKFSRRAQITDVRRAFNRATSPDTMSQIVMGNAKFVETVNKAMSHMGVKPVDLFLSFDKYNRGRLSIDDLTDGQFVTRSVTHLLTHPPTHSLTHSLACSLARLLACQSLSYSTPTCRSHRSPFTLTLTLTLTPYPSPFQPGLIKTSMYRKASVKTTNIKVPPPPRPPRPPRTAITPTTHKTHPHHPHLSCHTLLTPHPHPPCPPSTPRMRLGCYRPPVPRSTVAMVQRSSLTAMRRRWRKWPPHAPRARSLPTHRP